ncbi:MAG: ATP-binding protein, partial [Spirochaetota bacterium]
SIDNAKLYENLEGRVKERTKEIGDILNNVEQGIFTINSDLSINPEYSKKVIEIFERDDFGSKKFHSIFAKKQKQKLEIFLTQLFQNRFMSEKMFHSINPLKEYQLQLTENTTKYLSFQFSRIFKQDENGEITKNIDKVMVVIDDKTEEYQLQQQLEAKAKEQANKVEKLYQILNLETSIFTGFLKEGTEVIAVVRDKLLGGLDKLRNLSNIEESYRAVHTLKGNARALNLDSIGEVCHELEDELDKVRNNLDGVDENLYQLVKEGIERINLELQDGNNLFDKILGMKSALQAKETSSISTMESLLRNIVKKESSEQQKKVNFSFKVDRKIKEMEEKKLQVLKNPLLQIVRNAIAHGVEEPKERIHRGKPERSKVIVQIQVKGEQLVVACEDDGQGLDVEKLRQKAIEKQILTQTEAIGLSEEDCYQLIFRSGFSTAEKVTGTSGRGVGMDIVKSEIEKVGGSIRIETQKGVFTKFIIIV